MREPAFAYNRAPMPPLLVAVADSVFPNLDLAREVLSAIGAEVQLAPEPTPEAILRVAAGADGLLVTYAKITADMIAQMTRCRIISRFGIGVDNVDLAAATSAGIVVTKVPDYCIDEVSDHAVALLLALVRKIPLSNAHVHAGRWEMKAVVPIHRLRGTVLGLVGFGRIPQLVAPKAKAFGIRVIASDPFVPAEVFAREGVERVDFADLLKQSDYVSIHTPLLPETRGLFNADVFRADEARRLSREHRAGADRRRSGAGAGAGRGPAGRRGARRDAAGAAGRLAAARPGERDHHAAYQLLFRGVAARASAKGRGRGRRRAERTAAAQPGQSGSAADAKARCSSVTGDVVTTTDLSTQSRHRIPWSSLRGTSVACRRFASKFAARLREDVRMRAMVLTAPEQLMADEVARPRAGRAARCWCG